MQPPDVLPLSLLIVQATQFCNIDCTYCYLPNRAMKGRMPDRVLKAVVKRLEEHPHVRERVTVLWHAGEPLSVGPDFYRFAFREFAALKNAEYTHAIQTNATLVTEEMAALLATNDVHVGVSIDGPKEIHDARRVTRAGQGTYDKVANGVRRLLDKGVSVSALTVFSTSNIDHVDAVFANLAALGIPSVGLLIEEVDGVNASSDILKLPPQRLEQFWRDAIAASIKYNIRLRETDYLAPRVLGSPFFNAQTDPGHIVTVNQSGYFTTYSPELLGQSSPKHGTLILGNVLSTSLMEAFASAKNQLIRREIQAGVALCERECDYFDVCKGGHPSNKLAENGTFASAETEHCRRFIQPAAEAYLAVIGAYGRPAPT